MTAEKMTVICNIQSMRYTIYGSVYSISADFPKLEKKSIEELRELQGKLIPSYNATVKKTNTLREQYELDIIRIWKNRAKDVLQQYLDAAKIQLECEDDEGEKKDYESDIKVLTDLLDWKD